MERSKKLKLSIKKRVFVCAMMVLIVAVFSGCGIVSVVRNEDGKILAGTHKGDYLIDEDNFDADKYAQGIWEKEAIGYLNENATEFVVIKDAIDTDFAKCGEQYGHARAKSANTFNFIMKCDSTVLEVNTESRVGYMLMDAQPCDGTADFKLLIGPVYKGDSLRNSLPFIKFSMFTSQNDYAAVSKALHKIIDADVVPLLDAENAQGKSISLIGTFTAKESTEEYLVTPAVILSGGK